MRDLSMKTLANFGYPLKSKLALIDAGFANGGGVRRDSGEILSHGKLTDIHESQGMSRGTRGRL